jgi:hypothetical protein
MVTASHEATLPSQMAEEARTVPNDLSDPGQGLYMLQIATRYDARAKQVEAAHPRPDEAPTK